MKLKKVISILTACCTAVTTATAGFSLSSMAADTGITFTVGEAIGKPGDTIDLTVEVDKLSGDYVEAVNSGRLNISTYQSQDAKLVDSATATAGDAFKNAIAAGKNIDCSTYKWMFAANNELFESTDDTTILTFHLKLADSNKALALVKKLKIDGEGYVFENDEYRAVENNGEIATYTGYKVPISLANAYAASEVDDDFDVKTENGYVTLVFPVTPQETTTTSSTTTTTTTSTTADSTDTSTSTSVSTSSSTISTTSPTTTATTTTTKNVDGFALQMIGRADDGKGEFVNVGETAAIGCAVKNAEKEGIKLLTAKGRYILSDALNEVIKPSPMPDGSEVKDWFNCQDFLFSEDG